MKELKPTIPGGLMPNSQEVHGAVLVNLTIHQFGNEKTDKRIVQEVAQRHNASFSQDRYLKQLLPPSVMATIKSQISAIRGYHYRVTAPWFDRGIRMMASKFIMDYHHDIMKLISELQVYIREVADSLPTYEAEARRTRGSLFTAGDIPTRDEFIAAFNVKFELLPVSTEDDFRIGYITNETKKELKANNIKRFKQQTEHLISLAVDPLVRLQSAMSNLEHSPRIHGTTIDALNWWCDNLEKILVDDSKLSILRPLVDRIKLEVTTGYDPNGRPKYDPHAIEGALNCIKEVLIEFEQCLSN